MKSMEYARNITSWLEDILKDDARTGEAAFRNFVLQGREDIQCYRMSDAIHEAFTWGPTQEGDRFWCAVYMFYARYDNAILVNALLEQAQDLPDEYAMSIYDDLEQIETDVLEFEAMMDRYENLYDILNTFTLRIEPCDPSRSTDENKQKGIQ